MKRKYCQNCHKNLIAYVARENKCSPKVYLCKKCAPEYLHWGIVAYNKDSELP